MNRDRSTTGALYMTDDRGWGQTLTFVESQGAGWRPG